METGSFDHLPPKQFYPKHLREGLNLQRVPAHRGSNEAYREDEEYFYHAMYLLTQGTNPAMGREVLADLRRRSSKPQTPAMVRRILKDAGPVTGGGIVLPPPLREIRVNTYRVHRVVIKIARGLFAIETGQCIAAENCKDIRLIEKDEDVPEFYSQSWQASDERAVHPNVFSYRYHARDSLHLLSMLFWRAFMFCVTFDEPSGGHRPLDPPVN